MSEISIVSAPTAPLQSINVSSQGVSVSPIGSQLISSQTAPNLSVTSTSNISPSSVTSTPNLSGVGSSMGVPSSVNSLAATAGIPNSLPPVGQALNTLGVPNITAANLSSLTGNVTITGLSNLQFPKMPEFPGTDKAGIMLGSGPLSLAKQLKFNTIVPSFSPGTKINMGMAAAALSVLKAGMSANPSELVKHLLQGVVDDLKPQTASQLNNSVDSSEINGVKSQVGGVVDGAKSSYVDQFNRENPPQTTVDEDGNIIETKAPEPNLSGFPNTDNIVPQQGTSASQ